MILAAQEIINLYRSGQLLIAPFEESQVESASYDLRVGEEGITTSAKRKTNIREVGFLLVQPGDFAVIITLEELRLGPQYAARFGLRSKYARKGLIATTGLQVDPGYHGRLIVGLTNLTPRSISLPYKDDILSIEFHRLEEATTRPYSGPYQDRMSLQSEDIEAVVESEGLALSEVITTLRSLSQNVGTLVSEMNFLKWAIPAMIGIGMTIIGVLVAID